MQYDAKKWKVYTWKNWMMLHWIVNPGVAFAELFMGVRVARVTLLDKTSGKSWVELTTNVFSGEREEVGAPAADLPEGRALAFAGPG